MYLGIFLKQSFIKHTAKISFIKFTEGAVKARKLQLFVCEICTTDGRRCRVLVVYRLSKYYIFFFKDMYGNPSINLIVSPLLLRVLEIKLKQKKELIIRYLEAKVLNQVVCFR